MHPLRGLLLASTPIAVLGAVAGLAGCPQQSSPAAYTPITGITIDTSAVLGGLECGIGPGEVYRYTAVVWRSGADGGPSGPPLYSDVFDCFENGLFENLPASEAGTYDFFLEIFAYPYADTVEASGDAGALDLSCSWGFGSTCALQDASYAAALGGRAAWSARCTVTQADGAPATAACSTLTPSPEGGAGPSDG